LVVVPMYVFSSKIVTDGNGFPLTSVTVPLIWAFVIAQNKINNRKLKCFFMVLFYTGIHSVLYLCVIGNFCYTEIHRVFNLFFLEIHRD